MRVSTAHKILSRLHTRSWTDREEGAECAVKIAVIPSGTREEAKHCTQMVVESLKGCGCEILIKPYSYNQDCICEMTADPELAQCHMFLAVGGDGTIIHVAKIAAALDKPILGINAGKLGFTAVVEQEELSLLPRLVTGEYQEEHRLMLQVQRYGGNVQTTHHALNDAVVSSELAKIIDYRLALGDGERYRYRADGFIVCTPTGSTAYSLSAGGPVVDPRLDSLIYTPICPHSLFNRSVLFGADTRLEVYIPENRSRLFLTIDGEEPTELQPGDKLVFSRSPRWARFIQLTNKNFYDILNQKLVN